MRFGNRPAAGFVPAASVKGVWPGRLVSDALFHPLTAGHKLWHLSCLLSLSLLSACASQKSELIETASIPLNDFNIIRPKIPLILEDSHLGPYELPVNTSCDYLNSYVAALDQALGPDVDAPKEEMDESLWERGTETVEDYSTDALERAVRGLIPFRSWIRLLSGAESHSALIDRTVASGVVRRAYLKGLRQALSCPMPPVVRPELVDSLIADLAAKAAAREQAEEAAKEAEKNRESRCRRSDRRAGLCGDTDGNTVVDSATTQQDLTD